MKISFLKNRLIKLLLFTFLIFFLVFLFSFLLNLKKVQADINTRSVSVNSCDCQQLTISNHSISGTRPLLIVGVGLEDGKADKVVNSVTYNGQALTRLTQGVGGDKARTDVWYLNPSNNPPSGSYDVVINIQKKNKVTAGAITFNGVSDSDPIDIGTVQVDSGLSALSSSLSIPSAVDDLVMDVASIENASLTFGSGQSESWNLAIGGGNYSTGASRKISNSESTTMNVSFGSSNKFSHIGFNINKAPECDDGVDNDGDGQTDYPQDDGCQFPADDDETDPVGGVSSQVTKIKYSGAAYPNGTVTFQVEDENGNTCPNIESEVYRTGDNGRFQKDFNLCFKEVPILGIQATDSEGRTTRLFSLDRYFVRNIYFAEDIVFPPTMDFESPIALKGKNIKIEGYAYPNSKIEVIINGTFIHQVSANSEGFWEYETKTDNLRIGNHSVKARIISPYKSVFSKAYNFEVKNLAESKSDLNNDSVLDITDISIFLFRWGQGDDIIRKTLDFNEDGDVNISDFSIFLKSFSN